MPPVVRRAPLLERITARLNPADLFLWVLEEFGDEALDETLREYTVPIAIALNALAIVSRSYSQSESSGGLFDDSDAQGISRWLTWSASITAFGLALLSVANALYTTLRNRRYRLFEAPIDEEPSTPSARRVAVTSSPMSSSPLRLIKSIVRPSGPGPEPTVRPDSRQHVWEVSVWDPKKFHLELFTLFSPGHVMIYWMLLPATASGSRPSVTYVVAVVFSALLSLQLGFLRAKFEQQAIDNRLINKQVLNEYNTKFVHPALNRPVRDVGTQTRESATAASSRSALVDIYTPTTNIKRGFEVNPNPSYSGLLGGRNDGCDSPTRRLPRSSTTSALLPHPIRLSTGTWSPSQPLHATPGRAGARRGDGGSLGVYTHHASPLKKAASANHLRSDRGHTGAGSPLKRGGLAGDPHFLDAGSGGLRHRTGGDGRFSQRFENLQSNAAARRETSHV